MGMPKKVTFWHGNDKRVEPFIRFAKANGTNLHGAKRILELWVEKGWIERRTDGSFDVKSARPRQDEWTMGRLREEGFPTVA